MAATGAVIGVGAALFPGVWLGLFTSDPAVLAAGTRYLRIVGPCYGFFCTGRALYFASQGAGRLLWPLLSAVARLAIAAAGGWLVMRGLGASLPGLFAAMAAALVAMGCINVAAVQLGAWGGRTERT